MLLNKLQLYEVLRLLKITIICIKSTISTQTLKDIEKNEKDNINESVRLRKNGLAMKKVK